MRSQQNAEAPRITEDMLADHPLTILLVDDSRTNRLVFDCLFKRYPWSVHYAENGQISVEACATHAFDLILMDINMPVLDGIDAAKAIRAAEQATGSARTPIIALTSNYRDEQVQTYLAAGMDSHLVKPFKKDAMLHAILHVLNLPPATA